MKHSILIVEDEKALRDVYEMILSSKGFTVYTAENGVSGLGQLNKHKPEIVLLDVSMPVMNGIDFMKNVDLAEYESTVFIAFTNYSDNETEKNMKELGAQEMVLKSSLDPAGVVELVNRNLKP